MTKGLYRPFIARLIVICTVVTGGGLAGDLSRHLPDDPDQLRQPTSYATITAFLNEAGRSPQIDVQVIGQSVENRNLYRVRLSRGKRKTAGWRILIYAQQHGNEPAGKEAALYLIKKVAENPAWLPNDVEIFIIPQVNPDGAEKNQRRNARNTDLNRDHCLLDQPETRILHRTFRELQPQVAIDCHEFGRDSRDYSLRGWEKYPLIMMDCANHPILDESIYSAGVAWCERLQPVLENQGYPYRRYYVGGVPPLEEQRHSTLETDDGRNGLGLYGGLSFIIESGIRYNTPDPNADLGQRVKAYLAIFDQFIRNTESRETDQRAILEARRARLPQALPTDYFWAKTSNQTSLLPVIDRLTRDTLMIPAPNFMDQRVIKKCVPAPKAYLIPHEFRPPFQQLMERHAIAAQVLTQPEIRTVERCRLREIQIDDDLLYSRYSGRQVVVQDSVFTREFDAGALLVPLDNADARRAAVLLEPYLVFGLYDQKLFRELILPDSLLPVYRIME